MRISVKGKMDNGQPKATEIIVVDDKGTKKYADLRDAGRSTES